MPKPKRRARRPLGGALIRVKGQEGCIYGQLRPYGKRMQKLLLRPEEVAAANAAARADPTGRTKNAAQLAERLLMEWALEVEQETTEEGDGLRRVTVAEFLPEFFASLEGRVSEAHRKDIESRCRRFAAFADTRVMSEIGPEIVSDYFVKLAQSPGQAHKVEARKKDGRPRLDKDGKPVEVVVHDKLSPFTARNHRNALSVLWQCAIDRKAASENIWKGNAAKIARGQQFVPVNLTDADVAAIVARVRPAVRPIIAFLAETGMRLSEARALTWLSVEKDFSKITVAKSKSGRSRTLPMTERAKEILSARHAVHIATMQGRDLVFEDYSRSRIYRCFKDAVKKAGVDRRARVHDLRHHVGSALGATNQPVHVIMAALGHSQLSTVQRYMHHDADALSEAFRAFEAKKAPPPSEEKKAN